jgi:hypothetical protein
VHGDLLQIDRLVTHHPAVIWAPVTVRCSAEINGAVHKRQCRRLVLSLRIQSKRLANAPVAIAGVCGSEDSGAVGPFRSDADVQRMELLHKASANSFVRASK